MAPLYANAKLNFITFRIYRHFFSRPSFILCYLSTYPQFEFKKMVCTNIQYILDLSVNQIWCVVVKKIIYYILYDTHFHSQNSKSALMSSSSGVWI